MANLIGQWIGNTYGTHPSNIFAELTQQKKEILVLVKSAAPSSPAVEEFIGKFNQTGEGQIKIPINDLKDGRLGNISGEIIFTNSSDNLLEGSFKLSNGIEGVIKLSKFQLSNTSSGGKEPPQIIAKEYVITDPLRIYKNDLVGLIKLMQGVAGTTGSVVVTECSKGTKIAKYADSYLTSQDYLTNVDSFLLTVQVPMGSFVNILTLILNQHDPSRIISQSGDLVWSHSTPMMIKEYLIERSSKFLGYFKRYGLELNGLIFLFLLTVLPSFEFRARLIFMVAFIIFVFSYRLGYRWVSQTIIQINAEQPSSFKDRFPKLTYLLVTLLSAVISASIGWGIKSGLDKYLPKITSGLITPELHMPQTGNKRNTA